MNHFEFYGFPVAFDLDEVSLKRKFYELSKKYHPDFHISESEETQQHVLELSTRNNKAYQVLSDHDKRMEYVLQINHLLVEGEKYPLAPEFLMEMMEMNEALMDVEDAQQLADIKAQLFSAESALNNLLSALKTGFDSGEEKDQRQKLLEIRDLYYRKKYLLRIKDSLNTFAAR
ncbi:MAG: Fe-S protein assembly co-chaperone HscB [Sphingobacteriaceae bacterium]